MLMLEEIVHRACEARRVLSYRRPRAGVVAVRRVMMPGGHSAATFEIVLNALRGCFFISVLRYDGLAYVHTIRRRRSLHIYVVAASCCCCLCRCRAVAAAIAVESRSSSAKRQAVKQSKQLIEYYANDLNQNGRNEITFLLYRIFLDFFRYFVQFIDTWTNRKGYIILCPS